MTPSVGKLLHFRVGDWFVESAACRLSRNDETISIEPKVMDLLVLLAVRPGSVFSKDELFTALWPDVTVGEDTLARVVSKLRKALGDNSKTPRYLETIPKRGYRLIAAIDEIGAVGKSASSTNFFRYWSLAATIATVLIVTVMAVFARSEIGREQVVDRGSAEKLTARADDFYMQFTQSQNEAAITLYERAMADTPSYSPAQAGLANALVQRVVRWPDGPGENAAGAKTLREALDAGLNNTIEARELLSRALALAERAARISPDDATSHKALGFVYSAQGDFERATVAYMKSIALDEDAWAPLINLGEIFQINGDLRGALEYFERAYHVMARVYDDEPQRIGPWHAALGIVIGEGYEGLEQTQEAEMWYRRVLVLSPLNANATALLAHNLAASGDTAEARRLCTALVERTGPVANCNPFIGSTPLVK